MPRRVPAETSAPEPRFATNGFRLPNPIKEGEILTDITDKQWRLGRSIGVGGFGEVYLASDNLKSPVGSETPFVIKVEPHKNGPLFVEMNFYIRVAKPEMIECWMKEHRRKKLGMPSYCGSGSHFYKGEKYRFLVLPRFGIDLHQLFESHGRRFHLRTVLSIAIQVLDILEYVHEHGYSHSDIKDSNLLMGRGKDSGQIYLLDYGLASKYLDTFGNHKEYRQDYRKAHDGTIEYTSRDAHIGAHSRRGDLEILGYNLVQWLCGRLPWEDLVADPEKVADKKEKAMSDVLNFLQLCFNTAEPPAAMVWYLNYIAALDFSEKPDYALCKRMFKREISKLGFRYNGLITFDAAPLPSGNLKKKSKKSNWRHKEEPENIGKKPVPKRGVRSRTRQPCAQQNFNRMTRGSQFQHSPFLDEFSWEKVLLSDPEKQIRAYAEKVKQQNLKRKRLLSVLKDDDDSVTSESEVKDLLLSPATLVQRSVDAESLRNPTPAMVEQIERMRQKRNSVVPDVGIRGRSKSESRSNSPVDHAVTTTPTSPYSRRLRDRTGHHIVYMDLDNTPSSSSFSPRSHKSKIQHSKRLRARHQIDYAELDTSSISAEDFSPHPIKDFDSTPSSTSSSLRSHKSKVPHSRRLRARHQIEYAESDASAISAKDFCPSPIKAKRRRRSRSGSSLRRKRSERNLSISRMSSRSDGMDSDCSESGVISETKRPQIPTKQSLLSKHYQVRKQTYFIAKKNLRSVRNLRSTALLPFSKC